jgi:hypothetical protein
MADARRDACVAEATAAGAAAAVKAAAAAAALLAAASAASPRVRSALGVSSRAALVVTPGFGAYLVASQRALLECGRRR